MVYNAISDISGNVAQFTSYVDIVLNHAGALNAYQKKLTIPYDAAMQTNFNDIRFNIWNGAAWVYVPCWIESKTDSVTADVWIKNDYNSGDTVVRMYYGNDGLSSGSSGVDTFIKYHGATSAEYIDTVQPQITDIVYESIARRANTDSNVWFGVSDTLADSPNDAMHIKLYYERFYRFAWNNGEYTREYLPDDVESPGIYYHMMIQRYDTQADYYVDGDLKSSLTTNLPDEPMGLAMNFYDANGGDQKWSFIRKYTATEPTYTIGTPQHQRRHPIYQN